MRVWATVAMLLGLTASSGAAQNDAAARAAAAAANVQKQYVAETGLFCTGGGGDCWWWSANEMTALVDYARLAKSKDVVSVLANTFTAAKFRSPQTDTIGPFLDSWTDDDGWWGLAWVDAYDYAKTYDPERAGGYLALAKSIFAYMAGQWETTDCGGGLWQNLKPTHTKDAIANEVFLALGAALYRQTGEKQYLDWARKEWTWFERTGMIGPNHLVLDHLTSGKAANACAAQGAQYWTYNQGVVLGALTDLYEVDKASDPKAAKAMLGRAMEIADCVTSVRCGGNTAVSKFPLVDEHGVLMEACGTNPCTYGPAYQFKGIFVRNLAKLNAVTGRYTEFLAVNAKAVWEKDRNEDGMFGFYWDGGFYLPGNGKGAVEGMALDLLNTQMR